MDTPQITHLSLCSGYGGIDLGLRRCIPSLRTVAYAEIEAFACELLLARMEGGQLDAAPIWTDLKSFPWAKFCGLVDILSGGYPCQPFSTAGKRLGGEDPRHLWPFISSGIRLLQPRVCFFENVDGHITQGLHYVLSDLGGLGYRATWGVFSAAECGAPHQRKRVFVLAHRDGEGFPRHWGLKRLGLSSGRKAAEGCASEGGGFGSARALWPSRPGELQYGWEPPRVVADAVRNGWSKAERDAATMGDEERSEEGGKSESGPVAPSSDRGSSMGDSIVYGHSTCKISAGIDASEGEWRLQESARGSGSMGDARGEKSSGLSDGRGRDEMAATRQSGQRQAQSSLGRNPNGPASGLDYAELCVSCDNRTDELRLLGNGVVPATAELAFRTLSARLQ